MSAIIYLHIHVYICIYIYMHMHMQRSPPDRLQVLSGCGPDEVPEVPDPNLVIHHSVWTIRRVSLYINTQIYPYGM